MTTSDHRDDAPAAATDSPGNPTVVQCQPTPSGEAGESLRWAQLGLRLLGIMFVVNGASGFASAGIRLAVQLADARYEGFWVAWDLYTMSEVASATVSVAAGLYFAADGRWVIEKVFLPARPASSVEPDAREETNLCQ